MIKKFMKLSLAAFIAYTAITPVKSMDDDYLSQNIRIKKLDIQKYAPCKDSELCRRIGQCDKSEGWRNLYCLEHNNYEYKRDLHELEVMENKRNGTNNNDHPEPQSPYSPCVIF